MAETTINKVGKVGVGLMGSNVVWACAVSAKQDVYLYDESPEQLQRSLERLRGWFYDGKLSKQEAQAADSRLHPCKSLEEVVNQVDAVFESVFENLEVKKKVHAEIGRLAPSRVLQASNTSSLLCTPLAEASGRPDRFFCMNWSDPKTEELVELMWNAKTTEATKKAAVAWAKRLKMVPIVCRIDLMGYSFNRIWRAVKKESLYVAGLGAATPHDIDRAWMLLFGTPWGPFGLMDRIGLDTIRDVEMRYYDASGDERDKPPQMLFDMVDAGNLGEKSGKGFYNHPNPEYKQPGWLRKEPPWSDVM